MKRFRTSRQPEPAPAPAPQPVRRSVDGTTSRSPLGSQPIVIPPYNQRPPAPRPSQSPHPQEAMRTTHASATRTSQPAKSARSRPRMATALLVLAGIIIVVGAWVLFSTIKTNKAAVEHINQVSTNNSSTTATSSDVPDERPVTSHGYSNYVVAADLPRYLRIPKYNVKARVVRLGVLSDGALATPRSIWDVGWYDGSSKPGEAGAALMAGHYSGPTQPGAFAKIDGLVVGDMMAVEMGDGRIYNYEVVKTETVPDDQVSMAKTLVSVTPGKNGLNLITCAGEYSPKTANYSERTIVYAVQI